MSYLKSGNILLICSSLCLLTGCNSEEQHTSYFSDVNKEATVAIKAKKPKTNHVISREVNLAETDIIKPHDNNVELGNADPSDVISPLPHQDSAKLHDKYLTTANYNISLPADTTTKSGVSSFFLQNGLQVVVIPNHKIPAITQMVWYRTGAMDEEKGQSGLAHFLEHLMFKGTTNLTPGEFSRLVAAYGGNDNAFTMQDATAYFQKIPRQYLRLVMILEAERMRNLQLSDDEVLKERDVVLEERSSRVDNHPGQILGEKLRAALFSNHPYGIPTIGFRNEIESYDSAMVDTFYKRFYAPNNAILIISGAVTEDDVRAASEDIFGNIPPSDIDALPAPQKPILSLGSDVSNNNIIMHDKRVKQEEWSRLYLAPSISTENSKYGPALVVLSYILGGSETSHLYRELVENKKLATNTGSYYDDLSRSWTTFSLYASPTPHSTQEELESAISSVIENIIENGATDDELSRIKRQIHAQSIYAREGLSGIARIYGRALISGADINYVDNWPQDVESVSNEDIKAAARLVLNSNHYVTGTLLPAKEEISTSNSTNTSLNTQMNIEHNEKIND